MDLVNDAPKPALHLLALQPVLSPDKDEVEKQQQEQSRGIDQFHSTAGVEGHREPHAFPWRRPPRQPHIPRCPIPQASLAPVKVSTAPRSPGCPGVGTELTGPCLPPGWLAPTATQEQQHSQQHEGGPGPVETGAAVTEVQEAASPCLLERHDSRAGSEDPGQLQSTSYALGLPRSYGHLQQSGTSVPANWNLRLCEVSGDKAHQSCETGLPASLPA